MNISTNKIKLNCDMGESFGILNLGDDKNIMPLVDMANLACGFHSGDALTMYNTVELAVKNNVEIGAHPSYQDLVGFGRRSIAYSFDEIVSIVIYQIGALEAFCKIFDTNISYVKPHGALYNDMMKNEEIFKSILKAISSYNKNLNLMILSGPNNNIYKMIAKSYSIELIYEVFADRNYNDDGSLVPRTKHNALIKDEYEAVNNIKNLKKYGYLNSINGKKLFLDVDCICVHSDTNNSLKFITELKKVISYDYKTS